jgi:hypothetical protein
MVYCCGIFDNSPVILCHATDDFLCFCDTVMTYTDIVAAFEKHWTIHTLGQVSTFFGLHIVILDDCIIINQTGTAHGLITTVFGPSWSKQPDSSSHSTPMRTGTAYSESLACTIPINDRDLKYVEAEFGFKFHTILQGCMHITLSGLD